MAHASSSLSRAYMPNNVVYESVPGKLEFVWECMCARRAHDVIHVTFLVRADIWISYIHPRILRFVIGEFLTLRKLEERKRRFWLFNFSEVWRTKPLKCIESGFWRGRAEFICL